MGYAQAVFCTRCNAKYCDHLRDNRDTLLTPREVSCIRAACDPRLAGYKEIAATLGLTAGTLNVYLHRIYAKIGAPPGSGRLVHLILWAIAHHEQLDIALPKPEEFAWRQQ